MIAKDGTDPFGPVDDLPGWAGRADRLRSRVALDLRPKRQKGRWALQLDEVLGRQDGPTTIVASGLACLAVAYWAQLTPRHYLAGIEAALFTRPSPPNDAKGYTFALAPETRLPFNSWVVAEEPPAFVADLAIRWGSALIAPAKAAADLAAASAIVLVSACGSEGSMPPQRPV